MLNGRNFPVLVYKSEIWVERWCLGGALGGWGRERGDTDQDQRQTHTWQYMLHYTATQLYSEPWNIHRKLYNHTMLRAYTLHIIKTLYNQISNDAFYNRNFILSNNI